jgi:DNA polymerase III delta' subunit
MKNLAIAKLQSLSMANKLPHAWLFVGANHNYKLQTAEQFSQWLLCSDKQEDLACGKCRSCLLFTAGTHPDFCILKPAEDKTTITIDDVRSLVDFSVGNPQFAAHKIAILYPVESMHKQAANALLKTIEEPRGQSIFLLLAKHADLLLNTIVSRCQILSFADQTNPIDTSIVSEMINDLNQIWVTKQQTTSQIVEKWIKQWPEQVLYWFELMLSDLIRFKYTHDSSVLKLLNLDQMRICGYVDEQALWTILNRITEAKFWLGNNYKPNMQLILEDSLTLV